ncbi:MAG: ATP diphosphatase [Planctomycetota bacterium]|jgi:ATP diphosphatase
MAAIDSLLQLMIDLRDPKRGCPWDIKQTSASIAPHTLDETHELLEAIETGDIDNLKEELGDLLFNIVFHARIAEEQGQFDFEAVANGIVEKMIRRHPHVFDAGYDQPTDEAALSEQWQAHKSAEKSATEPTDFGNENGSNSAIFRARNIQQKAALYGFDWPHISMVFDKLEEEIAELKVAIQSGIEADISEELGDILFVCVNLARHSKVNAEIALRNTNQKFIRRFKYVQQQMLANGVVMDQRQLDQMESFWQQSKAVVG